MTTIVMNTLKAAVTEHDLPYTSISPGYAAGPTGLFAIGGTAAIDARALLPRTQLGSDKKKGLGAVYFGLQGDAGSAGQLVVQELDGTEYQYDLDVRDGGVARGVPGKGIQGQYLALGYQNLDGADFRLTYIDTGETAAQVRKL